MANIRKCEICGIEYIEDPTFLKIESGISKGGNHGRATALSRDELAEKCKGTPFGGECIYWKAPNLYESC